MDEARGQSDGARALDRDVQAEDVARLTSIDAIAAFLNHLGYPTAKRMQLASDALGSGSMQKKVKRAEILSEDETNALRVVFVQLDSVTAKARHDLVQAFGKAAVTDHMLILTSDFQTLEFVLIEKKERVSRRGATAQAMVELRPRVFVVPRRWPDKMLRVLRRLTYTMGDGLEQFDKLTSVFDAAHFDGGHFLNRALFADHFLEHRLREMPAWNDDPTNAFNSCRGYAATARSLIGGKPLAEAKREYFDPLWSILGFDAKPQASADGEPRADYDLLDGDGVRRAVALTYPFERWLDGPDSNDPDRPDENPGALVVTLLERGDADWAIVTNGRHWRLYSRAAHSRSTNFYEVDLPDIMVTSGMTDPNESFRYWWLFFRLEAFMPAEDEPDHAWLDTVAEGSRAYARRVEDELKRRVFYDVVPKLAEGFLHDRRSRLKKRAAPTEAELEQIREATLTLLYRLLFLLYAESRDLLPVREDAYYKISLKQAKEEIAQHGGASLTEADGKLTQHYKKLSTELYDKLADPRNGLFAAMANGRPDANVPVYNGGLFRLDSAQAADEREAEVCRFLNEHKIADQYLAIAIDRLARVEDPRGLDGDFKLEFVDYKSLGVRQLGSIYEGLLEFRLRIAKEDLAVKKGKSRDDWVPLSKVRGKARTAKQVSKGEVHLIRDKQDRKKAGAYYTPDNIVEYIVQNTVGPVLERKTEALRDRFREAEKTYHRELNNARANPKDLLGWRPQWGPALEGSAQGKGVFTPADQRRFARERASRHHAGLVDDLFDLKVLDPAMGSGHFLVEAVDFITDRLIHFLNAFPTNPVTATLDRTREAILTSLAEQGLPVDASFKEQLTDVHLLKRHVLKRCIYGVDLNPLATELSKVSLWLDAFTLGAPLSFLDHHLRTGNSLIGASIPQLQETRADSTAMSTAFMFGIDHEEIVSRAVNAVLHVARSTDSTAQEVAQSKEQFDEARCALAGHGILLDILVARHFGHDKAVGILQQGQDLDYSSRTAFLDSLPKQERRHVDKVEALAQEQRFFHWDLEFPEVFYRFEGFGDGRVVRRTPDDAGFDAIVGNPPYDDLSEHAAGRALPELQFFRGADYYDMARGGRLNLYRLFIVRALLLLRSRGFHSFIVPMSLMGDAFPLGVRRYVVEQQWLIEVSAFPQKDDPHTRVFFDAKLSTCVYRLERLSVDGRRITIRTFPRNTFTDPPKQCSLTFGDIQALDAHNLPLPATNDADIDTWRTMLSNPRLVRCGQVAKCYLGELMTNARNAHLTSDQPIGPRLLRGANINYYVLRHTPKQGDPLYLNEKAYLLEYADDPRSQHHLAERIGFQESSPIDNWRRLIACRIPAGHYCVHKIRYFASSSKYELSALLALFNSSLTEWRFGLTSTNNSLNEYEINALLLPRFDMPKNRDSSDRDIDERHMQLANGGTPEDWHTRVNSDIDQVCEDAVAWPASIHNALAAAGREMTRLAESQQQILLQHRDTLASMLAMDTARFIGGSALWGSQATIVDMSWAAFLAALHKNERICAIKPSQRNDELQAHFAHVTQELRSLRDVFVALRVAIDDVAWRLAR